MSGGPIWISGIVCLTDGETVMYGIRPAAPDQPLHTCKRLLIHYYGWQPTCTVLLRPDCPYSTVEVALRNLPGCLSVARSTKKRYSRFEPCRDPETQECSIFTYECAILSFDTLASRYTVTEMLRNGDVPGIPKQPEKDDPDWPWFSKPRTTAMSTNCWWSVFETHGDLEPERQFWLDHNLATPYSYIEWTRADELNPASQRSTLNKELDGDVEEVWIKKFVPVTNINDIPRGMVIAGMDIEAASCNFTQGRFASPLVAEDYVICIAVTLSRYPDINTNVQGYVLFYKSPYLTDSDAPIPELPPHTDQYEVYYYDDELAMIVAYFNLIRSATIVLSFRGFTFDNAYLLKRLVDRARQLQNQCPIPKALEQWLTHTEYSESQKVKQVANEVDDAEDDIPEKEYSTKDPNRFGFVNWIAGRYLDFHSQVNKHRKQLTSKYLLQPLTGHLSPFAQSPDYRIVTPPVRCNMSSAAAGSGLVYFIHAAPHQFGVDHYFWIRQRPQFAGQLKQITLRTVVDQISAILKKASADNALVANQQIDLFKLDMNFRDMNICWRKGEYLDIIKYCLRDARVLCFIDNYYRTVNDIFSLASENCTDAHAIMVRGQSIRITNKRSNYIRMHNYLNDILQARYLVKKSTSVDATTTAQQPATKEQHKQTILPFVNVHTGIIPPAPVEPPPKVAKPKRVSKYQGAIVLDPEAQIFIGDAPCGDFTSMYPSMVVVMGICTSTMITNPEDEREALLLGLPLRIIYIRRFPKNKPPKPPANGPYDIIYNSVKIQSIRTVEQLHEFHLTVTNLVYSIPITYESFITIDAGNWHRCVFVDIAALRGSPCEFQFRSVNEHIVRDLKQSRSATRKLQERYTKKDVMWYVLETLQNVKKVIMNSLYGTMASLREILAEVVTAVGRVALATAADYVKTLHYDPTTQLITTDTSKPLLVDKIIYGDTDSIIMAFTKLITDDDLAEKIAISSVEMTVKHLNMEFVGITMEKVIKVLFIIAPKTYAYKTIKGSITVKGFAYVRRDTIQAIVQLQNMGIINCLKVTDAKSLHEHLLVVEKDIRKWIGRMLATDPWADETMWQKFEPFADSDFECTKQLADTYVNPASQPHWVCNEDQRKRQPGSEVLTGGRVAFYFVLAAPKHTLKDPPPQSGQSDKLVNYARNATRVIVEERHQYKHYISYWISRGLKSMKKSLALLAPHLTALFLWAEEMASLREQGRPLITLLPSRCLDPDDGLPNRAYLEKCMARIPKKRKKADAATSVKMGDIRNLIANMPPAAATATATTAAVPMDLSDQKGLEPEPEPEPAPKRAKTQQKKKKKPAKAKQPTSKPAGTADIRNFFHKPV